MKFLCGSCKTKYQISDEKVRGKILTIRCKKCGAKVMVKESLTRTGSIAVAPLADKAKRARKKVSAAGAAGPLSSAFDVAMHQDYDEQPTSIGPLPGNEAEAGIEWFTAKDGVQYGPFAYGELLRQIESGELIGRHYVWHEGFGPWQRVRDTDDLKAYLPAAVETKPKPPPPPPPPADVSPATLDEPEAPGAQVVDFAAERERRAHSKPPPAATEVDNREDLPLVVAPAVAVAEVDDPTEARPAPEPALSEAEEGIESLASESATATGVEALVRPSEREDQLDDVLNLALGIEGEDATKQTRPDGTEPSDTADVAPPPDGKAAVLSQTVGQATPMDADSLFAAVPDSTAEGGILRENTQHFVQAAGVQNQKAKKKFGMVAGAVAAVVALGFVIAWGTGAVELSLHSVSAEQYANSLEDKNKPKDDTPAQPVTEAEQARTRLALLEGDPENAPPERVVDRIPTPAKSVTPSKRRRNAGSDRKKSKTAEVGDYEYVEDDGEPETGSRGPRGGSATSVSIDMHQSDKGLKKMEIAPSVPNSDVKSIEVPTTGRLTQSMIRSVVNARKKSVSICYQRELKGNTSLGGKMEFLVTVQPTGAVSKATVRTSEFKGTALAHCIAEKIVAWRFPEFDGDSQQVVVPFVLQRGSY